MPVTRTENISRMRDLLDNPMPNQPSFHQLLYMGAFALICGYAHGTIVTPTYFNTVTNSCNAQSSFCGPLTTNFTVSQCGDNDVATLVASLLQSRGPSHIPNFVVSVIIDAIQRIFSRRTPSYVFQKLFVGCEAKFNATTPVLWIALVLYVLATIFSRQVGFAFRCVTIAVRNGSVLSRVTSARLSRSFFQAIGILYRPVAALTVAKPFSLIIAITRKANNVQFIDFLIAKVIGTRIGISRDTMVYRHWIKVNSFNLMDRVVRGVSDPWQPALV